MAWVGAAVVVVAVIALLLRQLARFHVKVTLEQAADVTAIAQFGSSSGKGADRHQGPLVCRACVSLPFIHYYHLTCYFT